MKYKCLIIAAVLIGSCADKGEHNKAALAVGSYLLTSALSDNLFISANTGHANIVRIGDGLKAKLKELKPELRPECNARIVDRHGDLDASHVVEISCNKEPVIRIRLKYDSQYKSFHILGWRTSGLNRSSSKINEK